MNAYTRHAVVLAVSFAASAIAATGLAGPYLTWEGQGPVGQFLTMFLLPLSATAILFLTRSLLKHHAPANGDPAGQVAVQGIVFWILAFLAGVNVLMMAVLTGNAVPQPWPSRAVVVLLGVTLIAIGNLLPRTRPNFALGFRTERTLTDRQLWILTHRVSGYIVVAIGVVTIASGLFFSGTQVAAAPFIAMVAGAAIVCGYYVRATTLTKT